MYGGGTDRLEMGWCSTPSIVSDIDQTLGIAGPEYAKLSGLSGTHAGLLKDKPMPYKVGCNVEIHFWFLLFFLMLMERGK